MRFLPLALVLCLVGTARAAEPDTYIIQLLALHPYKGNLARLVKPATTPDWVKSIVTQGEGVAVPSKNVEIAGTPYRLDHVCKVHDCAGNTLDVLWSPGGRKVWAALIEGGKPPVMLGDPTGPQAKALTAASSSAGAPAPPPSPPAATSPPPAIVPAPAK